MSDCSNPQMRPYEGIHGQIAWGGGLRPTPLSYARNVNGVERIAEFIELDGERFVRERECRIEWRDDSHDTDDGYEYDGAYFCSACGEDLPYPLQEEWDDYQALVADYGNVPPWDKPPFKCCPNCGAKVRKRTA